MKNFVHKIWNWIFNLLCIVGCGYQLTNIATAYFKYGTVSRVWFTTPDKLDYPDLHFCFLYLVDALNWSQVSSKYGEAVMNMSTNYRMDYLTIGDILQFTPAKEELIDECSYRDNIGNDMIRNEKQCTSFSISKYVFQQYVCYHMMAKNQISISFESVQKSLFFERVMYEIRFSGQLSKARKIRTTVNNEGYPEISRTYAPGYYKRADQDVSILISCQNFTNFQLGFPYDEFTCQTGDEEYFTCRNWCLNNKTMKHLGRMPYTTFHNGISDKKLVSYSMLQNVTISKLLLKWDSECQKNCKFFPCTYTYCLTVGHADTSIQFDGEKASSTIRIESPSNPETYTKYFPSLPFLDFIIYVFSSLGTWFGLVIISCNPLGILSMVHTKVMNAIEERERRIQRNEILIRRMRRRVKLFRHV